MSADFWAGYVSGAASILIGNPLDLVKVRLQAGGTISGTVSGTASRTASGTASRSASAGPPGSTTVAQALFRRTAALATGSAAPVLGYGALNALLFVSYRQAELFLAPSLPDGGDPQPRSPTAGTTWIAGAVAGLATWIVSAPTELIKCRAQLAAQAGPHLAAAPSSYSIAKEVWRAEGVRGFFLGGTVTALRDSIGYGFYFWSYLLATDAWKRWSSGSSASSDSGDGGPPSAAATLMCGGLAGIVTWASVFPLDVIKTRLQAQALLPPRGGAAAPQAQPLIGARAVRLSTLDITRLAYREGGLGVFFRGLGVCSARAFVVNAVQWAVYEWIMREMGAGAHR